MEITPQAPLTGLTEEQRKAATDLAPHLWGNPGTPFSVKDFPPPTPNLKVLSKYLQAHCSPNVTIELARTGEQSFTAEAVWADEKGG